eukprot:6195117-Pleurochrysis_carterae.AAC.4
MPTKDPPRPPVSGYMECTPGIASEGHFARAAHDLVSRLSRSHAHERLHSQSYESAQRIAKPYSAIRLPDSTLPGYTGCGKSASEKLADLERDAIMFKYERRRLPQNVALGYMGHTPSRLSEETFAAGVNFTKAYANTADRARAEYHRSLQQSSSDSLHGRGLRRTSSCDGRDYSLPKTHALASAASHPKRIAGYTGFLPGVKAENLLATSHAEAAKWSVMHVRTRQSFSNKISD